MVRILAITAIILALGGIGWCVITRSVPFQPVSTPTAAPEPQPSSPIPTANESIILEEPAEGEVISSPATITGQARGNWYFEGTFPVVLTNWDGLIIAEGVATAQGEWMTESFVPFTADLTFITPNYGDTGNLILKKSNPSGLPENDDALEVTVKFR